MKVAAIGDLGAQIFQELPPGFIAAVNRRLQCPQLALDLTRHGAHGAGGLIRHLGDVILGLSPVAEQGVELAGLVLAEDDGGGLELLLFGQLAIFSSQVRHNLAG